MFIGGEDGKYGWCELVFDKDGKYLTNRMNIPVVNDDNGTPKWLDEALQKEGVPTGTTEQDSTTVKQ